MTEESPKSAARIPRVARELAKATGEPVEKFTLGDGTEYPHPITLERLEVADEQ